MLFYTISPIFWLHWPWYHACQTLLLHCLFAHGTLPHSPWGGLLLIRLDSGQVGSHPSLPQQKLTGLQYFCLCVCPQEAALCNAREHVQETLQVQGLLKEHMSTFFLYQSFGLKPWGRCSELGGCRAAPTHPTAGEACYSKYANNAALHREGHLDAAIQQKLPQK